MRIAVFFLSQHKYLRISGGRTPPLFYAYFTASCARFTAVITRKRFYLLKSHSVKHMIHKRAESLANICCSRGWVQEELRPWCIYTLEKWLGILFFFSVVVLWAILSGQCIETAAFLIPFYSLRRRMGGCHAKSALTCFLISIGSVIVVGLIIGSLLLVLPGWLLIVADALVVATALILRPAYPPQVQFSAKEEEANSRRKNKLLILFFFLQLFSIPFTDKRILAYSFCGITFCVITVIIQKQKGNTKNDYA